MRRFWRISNYADLSGTGGEKYASRWSSRGHRVVYLAESPAGAMLEILAHLPFESGELPLYYQLLEITAETELTSIEMPIFQDWRNNQELTRSIGDAWLLKRESSLARVPSAILPKTWNWVFNPLHPDAGRLKIESTTRERFDSRLFRFGRR